MAERLELIPPKTPLDRAHDLLERLLPPDASPQFVYDDHEVLMLHGQRCCFHLKPACQRCPLLDLCPTGQHRLSTGPGVVERPAPPSLPPNEASEFLFAVFEDGKDEVPGDGPE